MSASGSVHQKRVTGKLVCLDRLVVEGGAGGSGRCRAGGVALCV
jgi:hypothetical protein